MKLTTKKTVEVEITLTLPYFTKTICHYYKVYSEDYCIAVTNLAGYKGVQIQQSSLAFASTYEVCTEQEFNEMFNLINSELCHLATV
jgi:hypothetical protein